MAAILCLVIVAFLVLPEGTVAQLSRREGHAERGEEPTAENNDLAESEAKDSAAGDGQADGAGHGGSHRATLRRRGPRLRAHPARERGHRASGLRRTLAIIARDLHIAQGTARTHIENIYRKLDVHKQQELIDLVENHEG